MISANGQGLEELKRRFKAWRQVRPRSRRIPEDLWQSAVQAARDHGVSKTACRLGVNFYRLKRHLRGVQVPPTAESVEFVEIPRKVLSSGPGCVLELVDPKGLKLRIELRDLQGAETLARALWSQRG